MISNRGLAVWPEGREETFCTDHWRCRFRARNGKELSLKDISSLMSASLSAGVEFIKTENLYNFDGNPGYSLGQGE